MEVLKLFKEERKLRQAGFNYIVGFDEAGRGSLAGPVVVCAVFSNIEKIKKEKSKFKNIKDSKKLSFREREKFYKIIISHPDIKWVVSKVFPAVIDRINILEATKLAMERAVEKLKIKYQIPKIDFLILDGLMRVNLNIPQKSIIKADEKVFSCVVSSIIAKVQRDKIMEKYHQKYYQYGFDKHKGYPTDFHKKMIRKHSFCKIHRKSFEPVKSLFLHFNLKAV